MEKAEVKFASVKFDSIDSSKTLPAKFERMLSTLSLKKMFKGISGNLLKPLNIMLK